MERERKGDMQGTTGNQVQPIRARIYEAAIFAIYLEHLEEHGGLIVGNARYSSRQNKGEGMSLALIALNNSLLLRYFSLAPAHAVCPTDRLSLCPIAAFGFHPKKNQLGCLDKRARGKEPNRGPSPQQR